MEGSYQAEVAMAVEGCPEGERTAGEGCQGEVDLQIMDCCGIQS